MQLTILGGNQGREGIRIPKNFWEVQSPARVKLEMGVSWAGRYLLRPGMAAYTDRGVRTTANLRADMGSEIARTVCKQ